jgi:hypothetical protein
MPWTILRPSFRSCQVEPLTCTSCCALPSPHLRAGCQCAAEFAYACCQSPRCRIRICVQAAPVYAAEFCDSPNSRQPIPLTSFPAWLGQSLVQPMFVNNLRCRFSLWRTFNRINLRWRFLPLMAWLPAPLGLVLASLPKRAPRAHLTLWQQAIWSQFKSVRPHWNWSFQAWVHSYCGFFPFK